MSATITLDDVSVVRGATPVLDHVDLVVAPGRRIGVVGPNGVGKSTLLAACSGSVAPTNGSVALAPPTANVGWLRQEPERSAATVRERLHDRTGVASALRELDLATADVAGDHVGSADRYDAALTRWLDLGGPDLDGRIASVAAEIGLDDAVLDAPTASLSGGEAARVALAALLLSRFDVYLLDEPTNDLDLDGLHRLEQWVLGLSAGVLVVSHDRRFLDRVVTDVVEIDEFDHSVTWFGGGWSAYLTERERARRHAWQRYEENDAERRALRERAQRQREWAQQGRSKVRRSGENDKFIRAYRVDQTEQLAGKAAQTRRALDRLDVVAQPREPWQLRLDVPDAPRSGDVVARLTGVTVERGDFTLGPVDLLVEYGDRIALTGANGAGKTTLIDVVLGRIGPTSGRAELGASVVVGEIEQVRAQLDGADTMLRSFIDATGLTVSDARTLLAKFGLVGDHVDRATSSLSPGERTRAALALVMANGANLLVLDEPTNHLDLPAIEQLEQALDTFAGTVVLVTHDREFADRVRVTRRLHVARGTVDEPPDRDR